MRTVKLEEVRVGLKVLINPDSVFAYQGKGFTGEIIEISIDKFITGKTMVRVRWYTKDMIAHTANTYWPAQGSYKGDLLLLEPQQTEFDF